MNCSIAKQIESAPYNRAQLNLPESFANGQSYKVQYGRHLAANIGGVQTTTLRIPAGQSSGVTLDALLVDAGSGDFTFRLDIGANGTWDWTTTQNVNTTTTLSSPDLAAAFNEYWVSHGSPAIGSQDIPIAVWVSRGARVLLTNVITVQSNVPPTPTPGTPTPVVTGNSWTFMLYLDGDTAAIDNGLVHTSLTRALRQLEQNPNPQVHVVALIDGPAALDTFRVTFTPQAQYQPLGEKRMDDPATLVEFVQGVQQDFPADHYYLAIADHANGVQGIAWDTTSASNRTALLTPSKIRQALVTLTGNGAHPIDVLHFDGCSFGLLENLATAHGLVRYIIASENIGWGVFAYADYRALVGSATSPSNLARAVAQRYAQRVGEQQYPYTISALDLNRLDPALAALNLFADSLTSFASANQSNRTLLASIRAQSQKFDSGGTPFLEITGDDTFVDLVDFATRAKQQISVNGVPAAANSLITAVTGPQPLVVYESHRSGSFEYGGETHTWNLDGAHGVSIYYPPRSAGATFGNYMSGATFPNFVSNQWPSYLQVGVPPLGSGDPLPNDGPEPLAPLIPTRSTVYLSFVRR
jgi:hypothetical protein